MPIFTGPMLCPKYSGRGVYVRERVGREEKRERRGKRGYKEITLCKAVNIQRKKMSCGNNSITI